MQSVCSLANWMGKKTSTATKKSIGEWKNEQQQLTTKKRGDILGNERKLSHVNALKSVLSNKPNKTNCKQINFR